MTSSTLHKCILEAFCVKNTVGSEEKIGSLSRLPSNNGLDVAVDVGGISKPWFWYRQYRRYIPQGDPRYTRILSLIILRLQSELMVS